LAAFVSCAAVGTPDTVVGTPEMSLIGTPDASHPQLEAAAKAIPAEPSRRTLAMANAIINFTLIFNTLHI
jgi:hypothetical protein